MVLRSALPFALTLIAASLTAHADDSTPLPDIVVTAARLAQPPREVIGDVTVISQQDIEQHAGETLPQLLSNQTGVQIASNGGPGQAASIFLRGATAQQTLVLIDGVRFESATVGTGSLQYLPLSQIDHIEILRGPAGSLYGADAVGGVIQIFTRQGQSKPVISANIASGNEGQEQANASISGKSGGTRYAAGLGHEETTAFPALTHAAPMSTNGGAYYNSNGSFSLSHDWNAHHQMGMSLIGARVSNHYDVEPSWTSLTTESYNYRNEASTGSTSWWTHDKWNARWTSRLLIGASLDDEFNYTPAGDNVYPQTQDTGNDIARIKTVNEQLSWQNDIAVGPGILSATAETLEQRVSGNTDYAINRRQVNSLQLGYLAHVGAWQYQVEARNDHNSQYGSHTSGTAMVAWQFTPGWQWGSSLSNGFRAPTFNELYYPGFGNANLKPETSVNLDSYLRYTHNEWQSKLTVFRNREYELLDYDADTYTTENIGRAVMQGASLELDWTAQRWTTGTHLDWLNAHDAANDNQLPRRARVSAGAFVAYTQSRWNARADIQSQGPRYDTDPNAQTMGGYAISNVSGDWQLATHWQLTANINNLFDKTYELAKGYSTAPRTYLLGLHIQL